ncbi:type II toxin-antitoxin system VapC family toxin [Haladaptatus sp. NG-WS-4]
MYCLDANIWIYYLDAGLDEHSVVRDSISELLANQPLFSTTVLQMEVVHYLSKQLAESSDATEHFLSLEDMLVADLTRSDVVTATELLEDHANTGIGGRDATIIAAMRRHDITELWTHDTGLKRLHDRLDWLTVVDPVE